MSRRMSTEESREARAWLRASSRFFKDPVKCYRSILVFEHAYKKVLERCSLKLAANYMTQITEYLSRISSKVRVIREKLPFQTTLLYTGDEQGPAS